MSKRRKKSQELTAFMLSSVILASITPTAVGVTATMSGNHQTGMEFDSPSGGGDNRQYDDNHFEVSLCETTDGGMTISSSFMLMDEPTHSNVEDAGFTLTFTDGSKLDIINAGNAAGSHDVSIPDHIGSGDTSKSFEDNSGISSTQTLEYEDPAAFGVEYHTASDFLADGLKMSFSHGSDDSSVSSIDDNWGLGATYVTSPGDNALTIGTAHHHDSSAADVGGHHVGVSAVTGDLTVAVGFADGYADEQERSDSDVVKAGVKYVTGDLTFNVGEPSDSDTTYATEAQYEDTAAASVSYSVASGVSAVLGYTTVDDSDDGSDDGSEWYIGANMGF